MDNVLIAIDSSESGFWLVCHAMSLNRRVKANIFILMVVDEERMKESADADEWIGKPEKRLESLLAEEYSNHTHIKYYTAHGSFEQEILKFIRGNDITLLILAQPPNKDSKKIERFMEMLESISKQTTCRIEIAQKIWGGGGKES